MIKPRKNAVGLITFINKVSPALKKPAEEIFYRSSGEISTLDDLVKSHKPLQCGLDELTPEARSLFLTVKEGHYNYLLTEEGQRYTSNRNESSEKLSAALATSQTAVQKPEPIIERPQNAFTNSDTLSTRPSPASQSTNYETPHKSKDANFKPEDLSPNIYRRGDEEKKVDESVSSVNFIRPEEAKPAITQESKPTKEIHWKDVYSERPAQQKTPQPLNNSPTQIATTSSSSTRYDNLPIHLKSMSAADVINSMSKEEINNKVNMNSALRVLGFPNLETLLKMPREKIAEAGATSSAITSYFIALNESILSPDGKQTQRVNPQEKLPQSYGNSKFVDLRGYTVKGSEDKSTITVDGKELTITGRTDYDTILYLFTKHSSGESPAEITKEVNFSYPNVFSWLKKAGVRVKQTQQLEQQIQSPVPEQQSPIQQDNSPILRTANSNEIRGYDVINVGDGKFIVDRKEYFVPRDESGLPLKEYLAIAEKTLKLHSAESSDLDISVANNFNLGKVREILYGSGMVKQREFAEYLDSSKQLVTFRDIMEHQGKRNSSGAHPAPPLNPLSNMPLPTNLNYKKREGKGKK